jgi:hypothetical protein
MLVDFFPQSHLLLLVSVAAEASVFSGAESGFQSNRSHRIFLFRSHALDWSATPAPAWPSPPPASRCFCSSLASRLAPVNSPVCEPGRLHSSRCVLRFAHRLLRVLLHLPRQARSESQLHGSFIFQLPAPADTVSGCSRDHCAKISFCIPSSCLVCQH